MLISLMGSIRASKVIVHNKERATRFRRATSSASSLAVVPSRTECGRRCETERNVPELELRHSDSIVRGAHASKIAKRRAAQVVVVQKWAFVFPGVARISPIRAPGG